MQPDPTTRDALPTPCSGALRCRAGQANPGQPSQPCAAPPCSLTISFPPSTSSAMWQYIGLCIKSAIQFACCLHTPHTCCSQQRFARALSGSAESPSPSRWLWSPSSHGAPWRPANLASRYRHGNKCCSSTSHFSSEDFEDSPRAAFVIAEEISVAEPFFQSYAQILCNDSV